MLHASRLRGSRVARRGHDAQPTTVFDLPQPAFTREFHGLFVGCAAALAEPARAARRYARPDGQGGHYRRTGLRATARQSFGEPQHIELGYFARGDVVSGIQQRDAAATGHPYLTNANLDSNLGDIGLYADAI